MLQHAVAAEMLLQTVQTCKIRELQIRAQRIRVHQIQVQPIHPSTDNFA